MRLETAILHHLEAQEITDQATLLGLLRDEGFHLTLSTLSRRMSRMQVRKEGGVYRQAAPARPAVPPTSIRKVQPCLLIMRTPPGRAQALAVALDAAGLPSLAGSVAGYDTIFVAATDPSLLDELEAEVQKALAAGF